MKKIEYHPNAFVTIKNVMEAARERAAFHEDELPIVNGLISLIEILAETLDEEAKLVNEGSVSAFNETQLELPL